MTLHPEQIRAALDHALDAADLDVTAPPHLEAPPPARVHLHGSRPMPARRRSLAVAATVLVAAGLGLGIAAVASQPHGGSPADRAAPRSPGPVVAAALDTPGLVLLDTADPPVTPADAPTRIAPKAHLRVFRSSDGRTVAVADRAADGDGSLDRFALEGQRSVEGAEVTSAYNGDLGSLDVSGWRAGDRQVRVATRGLSSQEHDAVVRPFVAASLADSLAEHIPEGFTEQYDGPDENPFSLVRLGTEADYVAGQGDDDERVSILRLDAVIDAEQLDRYAWYWTSNRPTVIDGVPALMAADPSGRASLYLARPDGMVIISAAAADVADYARSVVLLDAAGWAAHQATAKAPGSIHGTADATTQATPPP